jgi:hypothetical protein
LKQIIEHCFCGKVMNNVNIYEEEVLSKNCNTNIR